MTSTGRCTCSATQATVAVLPVPVAPRRTTSCSPPLIRLVISAMAAGWSPLGSKSDTTLNGATRRSRSVTGRMCRAYGGPRTTGSGEPSTRPSGATYHPGVTDPGPVRSVRIDAARREEIVQDLIRMTLRYGGHWWRYPAYRRAAESTTRASLGQSLTLVHREDSLEV